MVILNSGRNNLHVKVPDREIFKNWCTLIYTHQLFFFYFFVNCKQTADDSRCFTLFQDMEILYQKLCGERSSLCSTDWLASLFSCGTSWNLEDCSGFSPWTSSALWKHASGKTINKQLKSADTLCLFLVPRKKKTWSLAQPLQNLENPEGEALWAWFYSRPIQALKSNLSMTRDFILWSLAWFW